MKVRKNLLLYGSLLFPLSLIGQIITQDPGPGIVRFVNTGKMSVAPNNSGVTSLYVPNGVLMTGPNVSVQQNGITAIGGNFNNDVTSGNVFTSTSTSTFRFCGTAEQWIRGSANRTYYYIDFPNVEVDNKKSVSLASNMGMNAGNMNLKLGRFILRSDYVDATYARLAHLLVKTGSSVIPNLAPAAPLEKGVVEVELALGKSSAGDGREEKFFGFSPPFETMYADYFTYQVLLAPSPSNPGYFGQSIINPLTKLQSGKGYFVGQNVFPHSNPAEIEQYYPPIEGCEDAVFSERMVDSLRLNRWHFDLISPSLAFASDPSAGVGDAYTGEKIHLQDVTVPLLAGYNFLGNPFTAPLKLDELLVTGSSVSSNWNVSRSRSGSDDADLYSQIWVPINSTSGKPGGLATHEFIFDTSYLVGQTEGSTTWGDMDELAKSKGEIQIEPMQMFLVWAERDCTITIPASERTHGNINTLKSTSAYTINDELLIQVKDIDSDAIDRFCVLFRKGSSINSGDNYDATKFFNYSGGVSQIYNRTPDGTDLSVNQVNNGLESMVLSLQPCLVEKEVELTAHRLETLRSPEAVLLEDLKTGVKTNLKQTPFYRFTTQRGDKEDRFVLHFRVTTGMEDVQVRDIRVFHHNGILKITGLTAMDAGSRFNIYDMQGRDIFSDAIQDCAGGTYETSLSVVPGVYVVKISGKSPVTAKLICKQ